MKINEGEDQSLQVDPGEVCSESDWVERLKY